MTLAMVIDIRTRLPVSGGQAEESLVSPNEVARLLTERELREVERFSGIAATLVLVGWRAREAWSRANELVDQFQTNDPMPALFPDVVVGHLNALRVMSPASRVAIANLAQAATERLKASQKEGTSVGLPSHSGADERGAVPACEGVAAAMPRDSSASGAAALTSRDAADVPSAGAVASASATRVTPREQRVGSIPAGGTKASTEERMTTPMSDETIKLRDRVLAMLNGGPMKRSDIRRALDVRDMTLKHILNSLRRDGAAESVGWATGAFWRLVGDLRDKPGDVPVIRRGTPADKAIEQRAPAQDAKPRDFTFKERPESVEVTTKANGHAAPTTDFAEQLRRKRAHHVAIIEKIDGLLALEEGAP